MNATRHIPGQSIGAAGYRPPAFDTPIDLDLSRNECPWLGADDLSALTSGIAPEIAGRYPSTVDLAKALGDFAGAPAERVLVTAGGDDAIERTIRMAFHGAPDRRALLMHVPSFEMLRVYCHAQRRRALGVRWLRGEFPLDDVLRSLDGDVALVALVTPNNPTGRVVPVEAIEAVANRAAQLGALCLVDLAYVEFAGADPTPRLLGLENVVMIRTLSKAWGLAGLRVGYAIAPAPLTPRLRAIGGPYPVSGLSSAIATRLVTEGIGAMRGRVRQVHGSRASLAEVIREIGGEPLEGEANFVLARFDDARAVRDRLARRGIAIRVFPDDDALDGYARVTCPLRPQDSERLERALRGETP